MLTPAILCHRLRLTACSVPSVITVTSATPRSTESVKESGSNTVPQESEEESHRIQQVPTTSDTEFVHVPRVKQLWESSWLFQYSVVLFYDCPPPNFLMFLFSFSRRLIHIFPEQSSTFQFKKQQRYLTCINNRRSTGHESMR